MLLGWLLSPSGGLEWHLRALRRRERAWAPFRAALADWLDGWRPPTTRLLLLGPSAGWCLPDGFLAQFRQIEAVDLDPLAPLLFRRLHGRTLATAGTALRFTRADALDRLDALLAAYPDHAVLFANFLGQRRLHRRDDARTEAELAALRTRLVGRPWASFHDRLSGHTDDLVGTPPGFDGIGVLEPAALARRISPSGEWLDHLTTRVLPDAAPRRFMPWAISPGRVHWVEAGWVEP